MRVVGPSPTPPPNHSTRKSSGSNTPPAASAAVRAFVEPATSITRPPDFPHGVSGRADFFHDADSGLPLVSHGHQGRTEGADRPARRPRPPRPDAVGSTGRRRPLRARLLGPTRGAIDPVIPSPRTFEHFFAVPAREPSVISAERNRNANESHSLNR